MDEEYPPIREYSDEEIHARMLVATGQTSLDYETVLANILKEKAEREAAASDSASADLSAPTKGSAPTDSVGGNTATMPDGSPSEKPQSNPWFILFAILALIGQVIFFIPLAILALFGLADHPFLGYFVFRDIMRHS